MSDALPSTQNTTWLAQFSMCCISIVAAVILETCLCAYLSSPLRKGNIPRWCHYIIYMSKVCHHTVCPRMIPNTNTNGIVDMIATSNNVGMTMTGDVAMNTMHTSTSTNTSISTSNNNDDSSDCTMLDIENNKEGNTVPTATNNNTSTSDNVKKNASKSKMKLSQQTPLLVEPTDMTGDTDDDTNGTYGTNNPYETRDWVRLSHAIDRIARFVFPVTFIVMVLTMFIDVM